jgi:hypothetical protein
MTEELKNTEIFKSVSDFITELNREYEKWYERSVRRIYFIWYILQLVITLSGFIFALVSSVAVIKNDFCILGFKTEIAMILLPALSSALSSILLKFRIYDLWMIREQGRIGFQKLHKDGMVKLNAAATTDELQKLFQELVDKTNEIEQDQSVRFFSISKADLKQPGNS